MITSKLLTVAQYEFKQMTGTKAFIILTILGPFLILAITVLPSLLAMNPQVIQGNVSVGHAGLSAQQVGELREVLTDMQITLKEYSAEDQIREAVREGAIRLGIASQAQGEPVLFSKEAVDFTLVGRVQDVLGKAIVRDRLAGQGYDPQTILALTKAPQFSHITLSEQGEESSDSGGFGSGFFTVFTMAMLLYMTILLYGQMIGRSVVQEKTSKTVEILLSSLKPGELMGGKILGIGLAGVLQYGIWIVTTVIASTLLEPVIGPGMLSQINPGNLAALMVFFLLGYFLFGSAYAAIGAASQDEQQMGQMSLPLILFLIIPIMLLSSIIMNPSTGLAVGLSWFPLTSPIIMLARVVIETPAMWEILGSIAVLLCTIALVILGGGKIFRTGILLTGSKKKLGEVLTWLWKS